MNQPSDSGTGAQITALIQRVIAFVGDRVRPAWLVGGYVRDLKLGRLSHDLDVIVSEGGIRTARSLAAAFDGAWFVLDGERDVGRAILPVGSEARIEVDVARLRVPDLLDDLALRDFTINAIAMDLSARDASLFDPFDGSLDLERRLVRAVTEGAFRDDPLRILRGVRLVAELGFRLEDATFNLMRRDAELLSLVAPERVRDELMRIVIAPGAWQHVRLLANLGVLPYILPESAAQIDVAQSAPHTQDVFDHSRSVLAHLEGIYALLWPEGRHAIPTPSADDATVIASAEQWAEVWELLAPFAVDLREHLLTPLSAGHGRRDLLLWAALAHDWGKPAKRVEDEAGLVHFYDHDRWGALLAEARTQALRFAADEVAYVARLTDLHMRPAHLERAFPLTRRAVYRFYRDAGSTGPDCTLLSLADYLACYAAAPDPETWRRRAAVTHDLLDVYFRQHAARVAPVLFLNGDQIMAGWGLKPGPQIGDLLSGLREAQAVGEVNTEAEARAWLAEQIGRSAQC